MADEIVEATGSSAASGARSPLFAKGERPRFLEAAMKRALEAAFKQCEEIAADESLSAEDKTARTQAIMEPDNLRKVQHDALAEAKALIAQKEAEYAAGEPPPEPPPDAA